MGISRIIIVCLYFFLFWLTMLVDKKIERSRLDSAKRKAELLEYYFKELQVKYDNIERELLRRDKQYKELLERVNKNG